MTIPNSVLQVRADYVPGSLRYRHGILHMKRMDLEWNNESLCLQNCWHQMKIAWHTYSLFREIWQHHKSAQHISFILFTLTLPSETRWKKATSSANLSCLLRYFITPVSSSLSYSMSDFHCSPSGNITSVSPISGMDGNSSNSFRILRYSSLVVIIHFHWKWFLREFCWRMYLISYTQGIVACQWLAWLSSMFKI